jgi:prepilin-type N-terminal cleavage/methylation domain-containing protein
MLHRIREAKKNESGFTLIELLIVIVILGVLAAIVVFAVGAFNGDGKAAACKSDQKNLEIASEAFYAKSPTHLYPKAITDLTTPVATAYLKEAPTNITMVFAADGLTAPTSACV